MATYHQTVTIKKGESKSESYQLKSHERVVGLTTVGNWDESCAIGMEISIDDSESWYPIRDGILGRLAAIVGVKSNSFHVVPDYGHPLSDVGDDKIRLVAVNSLDIEQTQEFDRIIKICIRMYE